MRTDGASARPRMLLSAQAVLRALPASPEALATVWAARERLRALGPDAEHCTQLAGPEQLIDPESAFACARKLRREARALGDGKVLVMRAFVEELVRDPLRDGSCDLNLGLATARQLLLRINELGVPCALEADAPAPGLPLGPYLADLTACRVPRREARGSSPLRPLSDVQLVRALPQSVPAEGR